MKKKLSILKVESFVTSVDRKEVKGGTIFTTSIPTLRCPESFPPKCPSDVYLK